MKRSKALESTAYHEAGHAVIALKPMVVARQIHGRVSRGVVT